MFQNYMLRLICVAIYFEGQLDAISHVDIYPACHCYVEIKFYLIAFSFLKMIVVLIQFGPTPTMGATCCI